MKDKSTNGNTAAEDASFQQIELPLDPRDIYDAKQEETPPDPPSARTQEHMRRLAVAGLRDTNPRRSAKTEYVMRLLVNGRAPLETPPAVQEPLPERRAVPEPPPRPGAVTLENLTFDDLLAELENL